MHSLNKGRRGEREIISLLQPILDCVWSGVNLDPPKLERRTLGLAGEDIQGLEWLSLEVKHRETLALDKWWEQTVKQSVKRNGQHTIPVLIYKRNFVPWRVRMEANIGHHWRQGCVVDIGWEDFEWWFYYRSIYECNLELEGRQK